MSDDPEKKNPSDLPGNNAGDEAQDNNAAPDDDLDAEMDYIGSAELDDLDDIDLDDDFDESFDDDWDEFDDPLPGENLTENQAQPVNEEGKKAPASQDNETLKPAQKSFFMKHFNIIIIGLALLGAIVIFAVQLSGGPATPDNNVAANIASDIPADIPSDIVGQTPPSDAPPENVTSNNQPFQDSIPLIAQAPAPADNVVEEISLDDMAPINTQGPAPTGEISEAEQIEIASWEDMLAEDANLQVQDTETAIEEDAIPEDMGAPQLQEDVQREIAQAPAVQPARVEEAISILEDVPPASDSPQNETPNTAPDRQPSDPQANVNVAKKDTKIAELEGALEMRNAEIDTLGETLSAINAKIDAQTQTEAQKNNRIEELENTISQLQAKLRTAQESQTQQMAAPTPTRQVEPTRAAPVRSATNAQKTTQIQPVTRNAQRVQWSLRAAQPELAVIAPKGTNDLKSVTIGNYVVGLGQITAIENIDNRWVVIGTQGRLSQ